MIDASWQKERIDAHERYIIAAMRHVAEAEARLDTLRRKAREGHTNETAIAIAEQVLKTNRGILAEMKQHSDYIQSQFAYLNSLEERPAEQG